MLKINNEFTGLREAIAKDRKAQKDGTWGDDAKDNWCDVVTPEVVEKLLNAYDLAVLLITNAKEGNGLDGLG